MAGLPRGKAPVTGLKSARGREPSRDEFAAVAQPLLIDAVADAGGHVPLDRDVERGEPARGLEQRLHRNEIVAVAMDEQDRRARLDLGGELSGLASGGTTSSPE